MGVRRRAAPPTPSEDARVRELAPLAYALANDVRIPGADGDDARQEALVGLLKALRTHDPALGPIAPHVSVVVRAHLRDCLRYAGRHKHRMLTDAARYGTDPQAGGERDDPVALVETVPDWRWEGDTALERRREFAGLLRAWRTLLPAERRALLMVLDGRPYAHDKALDGAVQRARSRLRRAA